MPCCHHSQPIYAHPSPLGLPLTHTGGSTGRQRKARAIRPALGRFAHRCPIQPARAEPSFAGVKSGTNPPKRSSLLRPGHHSHLRKKPPMAPNAGSAVDEWRKCYLRDAVPERVSRAWRAVISTPSHACEEKARTERERERGREGIQDVSPAHHPSPCCLLACLLHAPSSAHSCRTTLVLLASGARTSLGSCRL